MQMIKQKNSDITGKTIQLLLCALIWYSEVVQQRFAVIPNALLLLGVLLVVVIVFDAMARRNAAVINKIPVAAWIMFFYLVATLLIGYFVSPHIGSHISHGMLAIELAVIMMAVCYYFVTRNSISFLVWNLFVMCLFTCTLFLYAPVVYFDEGVIRYSLSAEMNPNIFAMQLAVGIWVALYLVSKKKLNIFVGLAASAAFFYAILLTGSRKGLVGAVICIVCWVFYCYIPLSMSKNATNKLFKVGIVFMTAIVIAAIFIPFFMSSSIMERFLEFFNDGDGARTRMYEKGWEYLKEAPWFGYGYWGFAVFYGTYSHATLIEIPVTSGIPLALFYFYSYINIFKNLWKRRKMSEITQEAYMKTVDIRMGLTLMLMMMFYTVCVIHIYQTMSFICFAMIMAAYTIGAKQEDVESKV